MEPLIISSKNKIPGLYVYCNKCKLHVKESCGLTKKALKSCDYPEKHVFKAMIHKPGTDGEKAYKSFDTRDIDKAKQELIDFKRSLEANSFQKPEPKEPEENEKPLLLSDCMLKYLDFLNNVGVPEHFKKERSSGHIKEVERYFLYAVDAIESAGIQSSRLMVNKVNDSIVGKIHDYLLNEKEFSPKTYNKFMGMFNTFYEYLIEDCGYEMKNPFKKINFFQIVTGEVETIEMSEFRKLLKITTEKNGIKIFKNKIKKQLYKDYLKFGFELGLFTGRRREEIVMFKWNDIILDKKGNMVMIKSEDIKVNRIQHKRVQQEKKFIRVPVHGELKDLLNRMGYEKYKKTDKYILAPDSKETRITIMNNLSKGFTHFWGQLKIEKNITLKHLRKTYMSQLFLILGNNMALVSGHGDMNVIEKHYLGQDLIAKTANNLKFKAN
jgi:integrase